MIVIEAAGDRQLVERSGETVVLVLIGGAEVIQRTRDDAAQRPISISLLRKRRPRVVCVSLVGRRERDEGIGELAFDIVEMVVSGGDLQVEVFADFPLGTELPSIEPFVTALNLRRLIRGEVEVRIE